MVVQDVLVDFVVTLMRTAAEESSKRGKLSVEDLIFLVRKVLSLLTALFFRCWAQQCPSSNDCQRGLTAAQVRLSVCHSTFRASADAVLHAHGLACQC